jgi:hypothetical protein
MSLQTLGLGTFRFGITLTVEGWLLLKIGIATIEQTLKDTVPRQWVVLGTTCKVVNNRLLDTLDIRGLGGRFPLIIKKSDWNTVKEGILHGKVGEIKKSE